MKIGTRGSALALKQTHLFMDSLRDLYPNHPCEIVIVKTKGDIDTQTSLEEMGGFGAFVRELNNSLLNDEVDISVNSLKDMPVKPQHGVVIAAVLPRGSPEDVIVPCPLEELQSGSVVGTSSVRRTAIIRKLRPDLITENIRGNVNTRLNKLAEKKYDAIILARAGVDRLGLDIPYFALSLEDFPPSPGQGAIAMACRENDHETLALLNEINHQPTYEAVMLERKLMELLGADCSSPVGIHVSYHNQRMKLNALSLSKDGLSSRHFTDYINAADLDSLSAIADHLKEVF